MPPSRAAREGGTGIVAFANGDVAKWEGRPSPRTEPTSRPPVEAGPARCGTARFGLVRGCARTRERGESCAEPVRQPSWAGRAGRSWPFRAVPPCSRGTSSSSQKGVRRFTADLGGRPPGATGRLSAGALSEKLSEDIGTEHLSVSDRARRSSFLETVGTSSCRSTRGSPCGPTRHFAEIDDQLWLGERCLDVVSEKLRF